MLTEVTTCPVEGIDMPIDLRSLCDGSVILFKNNYRLLFLWYCMHAASCRCIFVIVGIFMHSRNCLFSILLLAHRYWPSGSRNAELLILRRATLQQFGWHRRLASPTVDKDPTVVWRHRRRAYHHQRLRRLTAHGKTHIGRSGCR